MEPVYVVLIVVVAAALIVFGYFLMKRLDYFLEENKRRISADIGGKPSDELRIAFENPAVASSVSEGLEALSKKYPDCKLYFFTGTAEQIHNALKTNCLDIGLVLSATEDGATLPLNKKEYYSDALGCSVKLLEEEKQYIRVLGGNNETLQEQQNMLTELIACVKG